MEGSGNTTEGGCFKLLEDCREGMDHNGMAVWTAKETSKYDSLNAVDR